MPKKSLPDLQVIIPYKDLQQLLSAAGEVETLRGEARSLQDQMSALRNDFTTLMEMFQEIKD